MNWLSGWVEKTAETSKKHHYISDHPPNHTHVLSVMPISLQFESTRPAVLWWRNLWLQATCRDRALTVHHWRHQRCNDNTRPDLTIAGIWMHQMIRHSSEITSRVPDTRAVRPPLPNGFADDIHPHHFENNNSDSLTTDCCAITLIFVCKMTLHVNIQGIRPPQR